MTVFIIGKGERIAFPKMHRGANILGSDIAYPLATQRAHFSNYGFAHPTNYEGVPYRVLMDGIVPPTSPLMGIFHSTYEYLLIDRKGHIWRTSIFYGKDQIVQSSSFVDNSDYNGWWLSGSGANWESETERLAGFLRTDPSEEQISDFVAKYQTGNGLNWTSISEIVREIHTLFPGEDTAEAKEKVAEEKRPGKKEKDSLVAFGTLFGVVNELRWIEGTKVHAGWQAHGPVNMRVMTAMAVDSFKLTYAAALMKNPKLPKHFDTPFARLFLERCVNWDNGSCVEGQDKIEAAAEAIISERERGETFKLIFNRGDV